MFTAIGRLTLRRRLVAVLAVPALFIVAGTTASASPAAHDTSTGSVAARAKGAKGATRKADLGTYLTNGGGRTLYLFAADHDHKSTCTGACASTWPPLITKGKPTAGG